MLYHRLNRRSLNRSVGLTVVGFFTAAGSARRLNRRGAFVYVGLTGEYTLHIFSCLFLLFAFVLVRLCS